jgi:hypothetical protein
MVRLVLAAFLAGVLQFGWGFYFWALSPMSKAMIGKLADEDKVVEALKSANPETGMYFVPFADSEGMSGDNPEACEAFQKRHAEGPLVQVMYRKEGAACMDPKQMGLGFAHMVAGSFVAGLLLLMAGPGLRTYFARALFVALLGVFASFTLNLAHPIWFLHPWKFHLLQSVFDVGSWVLAAVVLAALIRRAD